MKCTAMGPRLKALSKGVRLLSKYTDQVNILATASSIILNGVNDCKSTFIEVKFGKDFFVEYVANEEFKCKVDIKSLVLVFSVINLYPTVESCQINMDASNPKLKFRMKCRNHIYREFTIPYMEKETILHSSVSKRMAKPSFRAPARVLSNLFSHFSNSTKEVTIWLFDNSIRFKTYIEVDVANFFDLPCTSFALPSSDFQDYNFIQQMSITCNIKDIKAYLDFALHQNQLVAFYILAHGRPIELSFQCSPDYYSARIVLSTFEFADTQAIPRPPRFNQDEIGGRERAGQVRASPAAANESLNCNSTETTSFSDINAENPVAAAVVDINANLTSNAAHDEADRNNDMDGNLEQMEVENPNVPSPEDREPLSGLQQRESHGPCNVEFPSRDSDARQSNTQQQSNDFESSHGSTYVDNLNLTGILHILNSCSDQEELGLSLSSPEDIINLSGSELERYQWNYIMGGSQNEEEDNSSPVSIYASDSDED